MELGRVRPRLTQGGRKMCRRSATVLSRQQQSGGLETIEPPFFCRASRGPDETILRKLWLNHGKIRGQWKGHEFHCGLFAWLLSTRRERLVRIGRRQIRQCPVS